MSLVIGSVSVEVVPSARGFRERMDALVKGYTAKVEVDADTGKARAELAALARDRKVEVKADVDRTSFASAMRSMSGLSTGVGGIAAAGLALGPALLPVAAGLTAAFAGLAAPITAAGVGLGSFAVFAVPAFKSVTAASADMAKAQVAVDNALTSASRKSALARQAQLMASLSPATVAAARSLDKFKATFKSFQTALAPAIFPVFNAGLKAATALLPSLAQIARSVAPALTSLANGLARAFKSPEFRSFVAFVSSHAGPAIKAFANIIGGLGLGFGRLGAAFAPVGDKVVAGLGRLVDGFAKMTDSKGFKDFLAYAVANLPLVGKTLGDLVTAVVALSSAFAPYGPLVLDVLDKMLLKITDLLDTHPGIAGIAVAFGAVSLAMKPLGLLFTLAGKVWTAALWTWHAATVAWGVAAAGARGAASLWETAQLKLMYAMDTAKLIAAKVQTLALAAAQKIAEAASRAWAAAGRGLSAIFDVAKLIAARVQTLALAAAQKVAAAASAVWSAAVRGGRLALELLIGRSGIAKVQTLALAAAQKVSAAAATVWSAAQRAVSAALNVTKMIAFKVQTLALAAAQRVSAAAAKAWAAVQKGLDAVLSVAKLVAAKVATVALAAAQKAAAVAAGIWSAAQRVLNGLTSGTGLIVAKVRTLALAAAQKVAAVASAIWAAAQRGLNAVLEVGIVRYIASKVQVVAMMVAQKAVALATKAWAAIQLIMNAVLTANPIGIVIALIAALALGIIYAYKHSDTFRKIVDTAFRAVAAAGHFMWYDVLRPALKLLVETFLSVAGSIVHAAATAFGWVPGLGGKLKAAARTFDTFRDDVNRALSGVHDKNVNLKANGSITIDGHTIPAGLEAKILRYARGGPVPMVPGARAGRDTVPALLTPDEYVIRRDGSNLHDALRHFGVPGYATGGLVPNVKTAGATTPAKLAGWLLDATAAGVGPGLLSEIKSLAGAAAQAAKAAVVAAGAFSGGSGGTGGLRTLGRSIANEMGVGSQFGAIDFIFTRESGWNPNAQNPTSTAYGIPQFLDSTWGPYGGKTSNPTQQIRDGIMYMISRYGSPNQAASFWSAHHWYDKGGVIPEPVFGVGKSGQTYSFAEKGPELVMPAGQTAASGTVQNFHFLRTEMTPGSLTAAQHRADLERRVGRPS